MNKKNPNFLTVTDLSNFIGETGLIPVPFYKEKDYRPTIIPCRSIWEEKRKVKKLGKKKKPIEF